MADFNPNIPIGLTRAGDYNFSVMLCPDPWTTEEEMLTDARVWGMVNPHLGVIVQPDYYRQMAERARTDGETRREFLTKLCNVFQSERRKDWLKPGQIRELQRAVRVDELRTADGWVLFGGFDLSEGNDLYAASWLAVHRESGRFFADMDAWISERSLEESPNRALYLEWAKPAAANGGRPWLHVVPGSVMDMALFLDRVAELATGLDILAFGYDAYKAKLPVNSLKAWVTAYGGNPDCVMPVRQNFATFNSPVTELTWAVNASFDLAAGVQREVEGFTEPPLLFSANPMWPWEFGNCVLVESADGMENKKPLKASENAKVDNVQALMNAWVCFDLLDGRSM